MVTKDMEKSHQNIILLIIQKISVCHNKVVDLKEKHINTDNDVTCCML